MSDDPAIAAARAIVASNGEAANAFLKVVEILEPLRREQREWCVRQIDDLVHSGFKAELPDLLPKMDVTRELPPAVVDAVIEGEE